MSRKFIPGSSIKSLKSSVSSKVGSIVYGSQDIAGSKFMLPLNYGGLGTRFFEQLSTEADRVVQVDTINKITETKGSVKARGTRLAIEMRAKGVGKKDIILICSKTHAHQTIVLLATLFIGAIVCPINPEAPFKECLALVKKLKPKMCFCDSRTVSTIERILMMLNITSEVVSFGEVTGTTHFAKLFPFKEDSEFRPHFIDSPQKEVAFILPTQGTHDEPKLVCLSHHNIYMQCFNFMEIFGYPSKVISFFPLSWIIQTILACTSLEYGVTRIMAASFGERTACKMIHDFVIDAAVMGTELAMRLTGNVAVNDFNLNCLKTILVGVVNTSREDLLIMRRALPNVKFIQVYALTEAGIVAAVLPTNYGAALERPGSVGRLLRNCRIKVINTETRVPVGPNILGEILYHGDGLMLGYLKDHSGTLAVIEKGYLKTGDIGKYDEDGWIYLQGRIEDLIAHGNTMIIPNDMESCLASHPQVHDAVIIGNDQDVIACIQKKPDSKLTADALRMFFNKKMPQYSDVLSSILFVDELPRTSAGNVKRRFLRDQYLTQQKLEYTRSLASIGTSTIDESFIVEKNVENDKADKKMNNNKTSENNKTYKKADKK